MPDRYGRKFTMIIWYGVHVAAQYLILFDSSYWARFTGLLFFGLSQMKHSVVYVWMNELVPARHKVSVTSFLTSWDSGSIAIVCFYFLFISKDWFPIMLICVILSTVSWLGCVLLLPESPSWLLINGKTQEAIRVFN